MPRSLAEEKHEPFSLELSVFVDTGLGVGLWFVCVCCRDPGDCLFLVCSVAIPGDCLSLVACGLAALVSGKVSWLVMGHDGLQTQRKKSWVSGPGAITIDGGGECVDAVALQAWWEQHPFGSTRQTQAGDVCERVFWLTVLGLGRKVGVSGAGRDQEVACAS